MCAKIKNFNFPTFEQWRENKYKFKEMIGDYTCGIEIFCFGCNDNHENVYKAVISTDSEPLNIYARETVGLRPFHCDPRDIETLKKWYEDATIEINKLWTKYIASKYLICED